MYKIQNYKTSIGNICIMSCLADIFNYYNLDVTESIIFTLSEASLFYYKHFNLDDALRNNVPLTLFELKIGGMQYDLPLMIQNAIQYFDIRAESVSSLDMAEIKEFITRHVDQQHPVLSLLSRKHLSYMNKRYRDDITHSINILGYCWEKNELMVSDTYIPTTPVISYEGPLSVRDYYNSLFSSKDIFNKNFSFRNISFIDQKALPFTTLSLTTAIKPLKNTARNFLNGECLEGGILTGLNGYKQFVADFEEWMQADITPLVFDVMRIIHHRLTNFGGPVITNKLLANYMDYLFTKWHNSDYQRLNSMFWDLSRNWFIIANLFGKASFHMTKESKVNLYQRLVNIITLEEAVYNMIIEL